jgi:DNA adenine methylase
MQLALKYDVEVPIALKPLKSQLLKWIGNKQRFAPEIISFFPSNYNQYFEPFLGSGAVLGNLAPKHGFASDIYGPLIDIWQTLHNDPDLLLQWYSDRWNMIPRYGKEETYKRVLASFNKNPNGADFVFLTRSCYGGVIRFRQNDGYMSTPCGPHDPIPPDSFARRIDEWSVRTKNTVFECCDYSDAMALAKPGDIIYCDPPYSFSQTIVYGAHSFNLEKLFIEIEKCKTKGVFVVLSIDGTKKSGNTICNIQIPKELFAREVFVNTGRSMLKRFQMEGSTLEKELVTDRLLLTY